MVFYMVERSICLLVGYLFGNFITAEIVVRRLTGKSVLETGRTGNPGMANVMATLGFRPGITVLIGDLAKTVLASLVCWLLFSASMGRLSILYAGLGAALGHNFPLWMRFHGGKGVSTTCAAVFLTWPSWGFLSLIAGMLVVFATQYLCIGALFIPGVFAIFAFLFMGREYGIVGLVLTAMMFVRHFPALRKLPTPEREEEKTDVIGAIRSKWGRRGKGAEHD